MDLATTTQPDHTATVHRLGELRDHFEAYFDTGWFAVLIEGSPIQFTTIKEIRAALARHSLYPEDEATLRYGVNLLEQFIVQLRRFLLPVLRERLGISRLLAHPPRLSAQEYVYRQLIAQTFPANLDRLEVLTTDLADTLRARAS
ncbi:MAG: hypothetical protein ACLFPO_07965 [Spirochaetaceae bacterium]